jgi:hypothetical protein
MVAGVAGRVGNQFDAQIAVQHFDGRALRYDRGIVDRLETGPTDGQGAVEARAIGFIQNILNGGQRRTGQHRANRQRGGDEQTANHEPSGKEAERPRVRSDAEWKRNLPADFSLATRPRLGRGLAPSSTPLTHGKLWISAPAEFSRPVVTGDLPRLTPKLTCYSRDH